jgi:hypothetical protein
MKTTAHLETSVSMNERMNEWAVDYFMTMYKLQMLCSIKYIKDEYVQCNGKDQRARKWKYI